MADINLNINITVPDKEEMPVKEMFKKEKPVKADPLMKKKLELLKKQLEKKEPEVIPQAVGGA